MAKKLDYCPHCGCDLADPAEPRSGKQWRGFHHMIRLAADNWPEQSRNFQPVGTTKTARRDHLRAWLLVQAGYRWAMNEPLTRQDAMDWEIVKRVLAVAIQPNAAHPYRFSDERNGALVVEVPKSLRDITHEEFQPVFDEVLFIVERETGIKIEFIKKELRQYERPAKRARSAGAAGRGDHSCPADPEI